MKLYFPICENTIIKLLFPAFIVDYGNLYLNLLTISKYLDRTFKDAWISYLITQKALHIIKKFNPIQCHCP